METFATLSTFLFVALSLSVGLRLVRLSLDSRRPEVGVVGSALLVSILAASTLVTGILLPGRAGETVIALGFLLLVAVGVFPFIILWKVFRPGSHGMSWVVAAALFVLGTTYLVDMAGPGFHLTAGQPIPSGIFKWALIGAGLLSSIWQSSEALYRSLASAASRGGYEDNFYDQPRYALWAVGTSALGVLHVLIVAQYLGALPVTVVYLIIPLCTAIHAACLQFIYFPPKRLLVWVRA